MSHDSIKSIAEAYIKSVLTVEESLTGNPSDDAKMMPYRIETNLAPSREEYISFDNISMAEKVGHPNLTGLDRQYWADFFVRNQQEFSIRSTNPDHITKPMVADSEKHKLFVAPTHSKSLDPINNHAPELKPRGKEHTYLKCSDMDQARGCEFVVPGSHGAIFFMLADDSDKKARNPSVVYILKPYYTTRGVVQYGVYKIKGRRDSEVDQIVKDYIAHTNGMKITRNLYDVFENPEFGN